MGITAAAAVALIGDFNNWNTTDTQLQRDQFGVWSIFSPRRNSRRARLTHGSRIKVHITPASNANVPGSGNKPLDRMPRLHQTHHPGTAQLTQFRRRFLDAAPL